METKVESNVQADEDQNKGISRLFEIMKRYLRICGYYYKQDQMERKSICYQILMILYCGFCTLCVLFNAFRFVFAYGIATNLSTSKITPLAYITFHSEAVCFAVSMIISLPKNYDLLVQVFKSCGENHVTFSPRLCKITNVSFVVVLFLSFLLNGGRILLQKTARDHDALPLFKVPFDQLHGSYTPVGTFLDVVVSGVGYCGYYVLTVVYNIIGYCIFKEFASYSAKFKRLYEGPREDFEENVQELWNAHVMICDVLLQAETFLKHFVAISYLATMPIFCFLIYGLIQGQLPAAEEFGFVAFIFSMCVLQIVDTTLVGIFISDKAHEPLQHIFHSKLRTFSDATMQKLSLFVTRLSSEPIGYSVYGLFTVDRSTIVMVCGTILTYTVVVLQLQTDTHSGSDDSIPNINLTQLCLQV